MTAQRMADSEIMQRMETIHGEMRAALFDIRGDLKRIESKQEVTNGRVATHDLVLAYQRGGLRVLLIVMSIGLGIPSAVGATVGVLVATGVIGR